MAVFWDKVRAYERQLITEALIETGGSVSHAADKLGIFRSCLQRKMRKLGITREDIADQLERRTV